MTFVIDTVGKAVRHNMLVRSECRCGEVRHYSATELMMVFGGGPDLRSLPFECSKCKPSFKVVSVEAGKGQLRLHHPVKDQSTGAVRWVVDRPGFPFQRGGSGDAASTRH